MPGLEGMDEVGGGWQFGDVAEPDQHHFGGGAAVWRLFDFGDAFEQHLPGAAERGHAELVGDGGAADALGFRQFGAFAQVWNGFEAGDGVDQFQQV